MKVTFKIDMEEAIADIMASHIDYTEKNLLPSGELRPSINVDFMAGCIFWGNVNTHSGRT